MPSFKQPSRIVITCNIRLTPFLHKELEEMGWKIFEKFPTGAELRGTLNDCIRLNLTLRCASQILYGLKSFPCNSPNELYDAVSTIQWENMFSSEGYFSVTSNVDHPTVNNNLFVNVKIKDAIVDRFRDKLNIRPDSGSDLDRAVIHLFWKGDQADIFIDTSGETLAKHGYRRIPGHAPMMESLAAGTLLASKWNRVSPFINPMCGSGTVAIEAAMLATKRSPGLYRDNYSFMHITGFDREVYDKEKQQLIDNIIFLNNLKIVATDISEDAINISKINAGAAGVEDLIDFDVCDFRDTEIPERPGVVYFNPEYGERLGNADELQETYSEIGHFLKQKCKGYTGYIFTGNLELAKKIGLKASRRIEFYNGKIDCRLLEYELYGGTKRVDS
jgi:23S rRNA G2445 N2-methylase RlmL